MSDFRYGSLSVVREARPPSEIQADLKKIDDRLFLEQQMCFDNRVVWCVVCDVGLGQPPVTLLEWRDNKGDPIPDLGSGILDRVQRMERDGRRLAQKVVEKNAAKVAEDQRRARLEYEEVQRMFEKAAHPVHSAVLPRSQSLRMSRDKARARGEKA